MNINFRLVLSLLGYLIAWVGLLMLIPMFIDLALGGSSASTFFLIAMIVSFVGFAFAFANKQEQKTTISLKEGLLLTFLSWVSVVIVASLPFKYTYLGLSYTDAFFETMSGITTTGASVLINLDEISQALHFWRAFLGWLGGIGVIVTSIILIPSMQGGMQLFKSEGFETFDSAFDKARGLAFGIVAIYVIITIFILFALLFLTKLNFFDSLIHTMSSVSTTGFSNKVDSVAYFNDINAEIIITIAMFSAGVPYILLYYFFFLRKTNIFKDQQVLGYLKLTILLILSILFWLIYNNGMHFFTALRYSSFTSISLLTGTGLSIVDYGNWGSFPIMLLLSAMIIGGSSGSKTAGLKIYRVQIASKLLKTNIVKLFLRNHVILPIYNGKVIEPNAAMSILAYFSIYFFLIFVGSAILSFLGLDFLTSLSASIATISNVGPGFGHLIGPSGTYTMIPEVGKWVLSALMLLGRLEILIILAIFTKQFWRN